MKPGTGRLALAFVVALAGWLGVQVFGLSRRPHPQHDLMLAAARRTESAFAVVDSVKRGRNYPFPADSTIPWRALLGEDYTVMTTTLGSREAKEVSTNPAWASLMVRWLVSAGVTEADTVAILASGSFPALAIATQAAVVALDAVPVVMFSLGASSYGANVERATIVDMERWVREAGVLDVRPTIITAGGENDVALGLPTEGLAWLKAAAAREGTELRRFPSLGAAITFRSELLRRLHPAAVVNIGGGQAVLGACAHAATLPVGPWPVGVPCSCPDRGALARIAAAGVPVIHLLNLRGLAALYGLDFEPGGRYVNTGSITNQVRPHPAWILAALAAVIASLAVPRRTES